MAPTVGVFTHNNSGALQNPRSLSGDSSCLRFVLEFNVNFNAIVRTAMTDEHLGKTAPKKS